MYFNDDEHIMEVTRERSEYTWHLSVHINIAVCTVYTNRRLGLLANAQLCNERDSRTTVTIHTDVTVHVVYNTAHAVNSLYMYIE